MIAQTLVEYGFIQSFSAGFMQVFHRVEYFFSTGNTRYFVFLGLALFVLLICIGRRAKLRL